MRLIIFILLLLMLVALDVLVAVSASLYAGRGAVILVALFFGVMAIAVWRRWDAVLFTVQSLAIAGLLLRGVVVTEGQVLPSVVRSLILLVVANGLVYAVVRLRPSA